MLTEVKEHLKLMFISFKYNISKEMTNKTSFIMQIIFMMLNNSSFIIQWLILFSLKSNIGGYSQSDVLILWALSASTYGISHIFFYNIYSMPELITNGKLDVYLTQPKNVLFNLATSTTSVSAIGDWLYGYAVVLIISPSFYSLSLFTLFSITGGIILASFSAILGSLSFWIKKSNIIMEHALSIALVTSTYPDGIFKDLIRLVLYTIIPVGFMVFIPIDVINSFSLSLVLIVVLVTIIFVLLAFTIFNQGLKKYNSGNLMSARI